MQGANAGSCVAHMKLTTYGHVHEHTVTDPYNSVDKFRLQQPLSSSANLAFFYKSLNTLYNTVNVIMRLNTKVKLILLTSTSLFYKFNFSTGHVLI